MLTDSLAPWVAGKTNLNSYMEQDAGAIVERVVRRSGISIAELARRINVDRRSIYYWFKQSTLNIDTIYKIGQALGHDFSQDFPNLIPASSHFSSFGQSERRRDEDPGAVDFWKQKYINLLERYNDLLVKIGSVEES